MSAWSNGMWDGSVPAAEAVASAEPTRRPDGTHRVVITGMGAVTPAGVGVAALWEAVMGRRCCIGPVTRFDTSDYEVHVAGEIDGFDACEHGLTKKEARRFERFVQYAIVASDEAMAQAGLDMDAEDATRVACVFGTGIGGIDELQSGFSTLAEKGPKRVNPLFIPTMIGNIAAGNLSIRYGLQGECLNVVTACATGAHCIGSAVRDIRHGYIDAALAGGSEESVSPICLAGFAYLGALSRPTTPSRRRCRSTCAAAGSWPEKAPARWCWSRWSYAAARGAQVLAEVTGFGSTGDAYHMTAPDPTGAGVVRAMRQALAEGGFVPADVGHLNAHGTGDARQRRHRGACALGAVRGRGGPRRSGGVRAGRGRRHAGSRRGGGGHRVRAVRPDRACRRPPASPSPTRTVP